MPKKGRAPVDPIGTIAKDGFIGYVEEEEHKADEPGVLWIDIEHIANNPYQHAEVVDAEDFDTLVASIKSDGFLGALNVSPLEEDGQYYLNGGGHQRRDAARAAGLTKLPVFVTDPPSDRSILAFRVARENTTRVNNSIINLGNLYQQMIEDFGLTQEEIAQRINKDRNHVKFALMAVRSPDDIQNMLRQRPDSLRVMTYFRRLEQVEDRQPIMERFLNGDLTAEGVRREVEAVLARQRGETVEDDVPMPAEQPVAVVDRVEIPLSVETSTPSLPSEEKEERERRTTSSVPTSFVQPSLIISPNDAPLTLLPVSDAQEAQVPDASLEFERQLQEVDEPFVGTLQFVMDSHSIEKMTLAQTEIVLFYARRWNGLIEQLIERVQVSQE